MTRHIHLTMADPLYEALERKRTESGYMTVQEYINEIVRQKVLAKPIENKKGKVGRPKKADDPYLDYFSKNTSKH